MFVKHRPKTKMLKLEKSVTVLGLRLLYLLNLYSSSVIAGSVINRYLFMQIQTSIIILPVTQNIILTYFPVFSWKIFKDIAFNYNCIVLLLKQNV